MSKERKLREYAEDRLAAYADGADSLARLKAEQSANAPETSKKRLPLARKFAFGFSAFAAVVIAVVCVFRFVPLVGDSGSDEEVVLRQESASDVSGGNLADHVIPKSESGGYQYSDAINEASAMPLGASINERTSYLILSVDEYGSLQSDSEKRTECYTFSVSVDGVAAEGILSFGEIDAKAFPYSCDKESTVAGQTFLYGTEGDILFGKIVTDAECVYVLRCEGGTEEARLAALRKVFSEK